MEETRALSPVEAHPERLNIFQTITVHKVRYTEVQRFIEHHTGCRLDIPESENRSNHSVIPLFISPATKEEMKKFEAFKAGNDDSQALKAILAGLCREGHFPAGHFDIDVSW